MDGSLILLPCKEIQINRRYLSVVESVSVSVAVQCSVCNEICTWDREEATTHVLSCIMVLVILLEYSNIAINRSISGLCVYNI